MNTDFKPTLHDKAKNTDMLNELNSLIDQNSKLVKELEFMRATVAKYREDPGAVNSENRFTEEDV